MMIAQAIFEYPTNEDDDNMTSISTIRSDSMDVASLSVYIPKKGISTNDLNRRRLSLRSHEDNQSIGGGRTYPNSAPHSEGENDDEDEIISNHVDDIGRDDIKDYPPALINKNDGEESVSDGGLDNDDETMSIDSTKCYPNNLYHSKGFLTIASLHKTDSPSGYLTHHLSALPSSSLRYSNAVRRNTRFASPSLSHINSPVVEEEIPAHDISHPSPQDNDSSTIHRDEIHCTFEELHEVGELPPLSD